MSRTARILLVFAAICASGGKFAISLEKAPPEREPPEKYVLDYPVMDRCCPPIRSTFAEAGRTMSVVGSKRFTHKLNGGFGLPVQMKVEGKYLIHLGADLGWYRVGEPVFAIGAGVVRESHGPPPEDKTQSKSRKEAPQRNSIPAAMPWGNIVVIEHRLPSGDFVTTIYGHLNPDRRVAVGDVVKAGQQLGTIGRKHASVNGGYNPHLHFGVRSGRIVEPGATLMRVRIGEETHDLKIAAVNEEFLELATTVELPRNLTLRINGKAYSVERREGKSFLPARALWGFSRPDFALVGYDLTTDGWRDPIAFLREQRADTQPASFLVDK